MTDHGSERTGNEGIARHNDPVYQWANDNRRRKWCGNWDGRPNDFATADGDEQRKEEFLAPSNAFLPPSDTFEPPQPWSDC